MRPPPALPGENTLFSQDARITGSSSAQRRPVSIAASPAGSPPNTSFRISGRRNDTVTPDFARSPRAPSPPVTKFQGAMPEKGACASSAAPLSQGTGACALSAAPSATGARASGAAPLSYGIIHVTGACAWGLLLSASARRPTHQAPLPPATRRAVVRLLRLHVAPINEGVLLLHLSAMRWRSV